jgi:hypothetical protein
MMAAEITQREQLLSFCAIHSIANRYPDSFFSGTDDLKGFLSLPLPPGIIMCNKAKRAAAELNPTAAPVD